VGPLAVHAEDRHWAIAAVVATVIAAAVSAYAAYEAGQQQEAMAKYQSKIAKNQAQAAQNAAQVAESNHREQDRRIMAEQRALVGGSGLSTEGAPLFVMLDSAKQAELDAIRLRYGGQLQAGGFLDQAKLFQYEGRQAAQAGELAAGTTLLTGAASAAGGYARTRTPSTGGIGYGAASTPPPGNYPY
jgi:hypothetical protein